MPEGTKWKEKEWCEHNHNPISRMQLCSGTVMSNMSRASWSSDEGANEGENNNAWNMEPMMVPVSQNIENNTMLLCTSIATTSGVTTWPLYGLPLGYMPLGFVPPVLSQANVGTMPNVLQNNPLCQNLPLIANLPQLGIYSQLLETMWHQWIWGYWIVLPQLALQPPCDNKIWDLCSRPCCATIREGPLQILSSP